MTHSNPSAKNLRRRSTRPSTSTSPDEPIPNPKSPDPASLDPAAKTKPFHAHTFHLPVALTFTDSLICLSLLLIALAVRIYRIASIPSVIFDEIHYLNFDAFILKRSYFFDVNPVFGKLIIAYIAKLFGFVPAEKFESLGQALPESQAFAARIPAALFGAFTVPVFYRLCRLLRFSVWASVTGAFFILLDMMHVIQSRITMVDSVLVFFTCLAFYNALLLWDAKNVVVIKRAAVTVMDTATVLMYLVATGVCCGLSVSVRWTAFATPVLIFMISLFGVGPFLREPMHIIELVVLYGAAFLSYIGSFAVFLMNVNHSGSGDGFMSKEFRACLIGSAHYTGPEGCQMSLLRRIWEVNRTIFQYSKGIRGNDKWGSSWFQWIVNWRGALYYRMAPPGKSELAMIYVLMNPVMVLCINALMLVFIGALFLQVRYRKQVRTTEAFKQHLRRGGALFFGWVGSMLPTMVVYRSGPLYQYLPGLFFAQALGACGFDLVPARARPIVAIVMATGMVSAFVYWSPWVYGVPMGHAEHIARRWLPKWD